MAQDHFSIDPGQVSPLVGEFSSAAEILKEQVTTFATKAENVNDAFGVLAQSTAALTQYVAMTQATVANLQRLQTQLSGYSEAVQASVAAYQQTDQTHAENLRAIQP